jgi:glycosyltransferase involved in cell wall biosynthesis
LKTVVLMPCYNELSSLEATVADLFEHQPDLALLVIDDNSPDGTGALADRLAASDQRVTVLHRPGKAGLGAAYLAGFDWALARDYELIVEMDADGSHRAQDLGAMLDLARQGNALVIGSRWINGGAVRNWSALRIAISRLGNRYARFMLGSRIRDLTAGFRVYQRSLLEQLTKTAPQAQGYAFQVELAMQAQQLGFAVLESPITFIERENGSSKMSAAIVLEALRLVTAWGVRGRFR